MNLNKLSKALFIIFVSSSNFFSQEFNTLAYRDFNIKYLETNPSNYNFSYPILSNLLDSANFSPPIDGVYLKAGFGHRYFTTTPLRSDNHGGIDFWQNHTSGTTIFDDNNKAPIICMCDGYISQVLEGVDSVIDLTATGRSVRVTCDSSFQTLGYKIKINYRHLSSLGILAKMADTAAFGAISIKKGDTIGLIGKSGTTSNVHLHLSTQTIHPIYGSAFVSTARLFDPTKSPGVMGILQNAKVKLLHNSPDSAVFRVIWPFNQTINQFQFINLTDTVTFNKEDAYNTGSAIRDNYDCLPNVSVFAYQFNGSLTAKARYSSEMNNIPSIYPASPNRDTNLSIYGYPHIPINEDSVSYVYDFVVHNLSPSHKESDFIVKLSDVWGYTVEGSFPTNVNLNENTNFDFNLFPNPTSGDITLTFENRGKKEISIIDLSGKKVYEDIENSLNKNIDINNLSKGIYFLTIRYKDEFKTVKIIKN